MNLAHLLVRSALSDPAAPAVAHGTDVLWTYGTLARRVAVLAGRLRERYGLAPGDRVALAMSNTPAFVEILFACWHAGLAAVPMNAKLHPEELAFMLSNSGARLCFVTPDLAAALGGVSGAMAAPAAVVESASAEYRGLLEGDPVAMAEVEADSLAWLFYTSGTTGRPKGAMITHRNLMAMLLSYLADVDGVAPGDSLLHAAPMSHGSGIYILPHVAAGARQVVPESGQFDPAEVFALLAAHPGVGMFMAPTMVRRLLDGADGRTAPDGLKTIVYGGGPMYVADLEQAMARFGQVFVQIYGQAESPMTITALSRARHADSGHPDYAARIASVGRAQTVVEVRVADVEDRGLPPGALGEVLVRGDSVIPGYWDNPEGSAETLRGGWLHSGDMGVMDEAGFLTLKDRSKDVIISGGSNIYPREIEELLLRHAAVRECAVVGRPHREWGEEVAAFVVTAENAAIDGAEPVAALQEALDAHCLAHIARFKRPRAYRFVEALPKNNYGKVLKTALRERLAAEAAEAE